MASAKKLPSGSWRVNLYIGKTPDGKRQYKSFTADTKKEAEFLAAQYNQTKEDVCRDNITLEEASRAYVTVKSNVLSPSTIRGYYTIINNSVQGLMKTRLKDITAEQIQAEINELAQSHSSKTCRNVHNFISAVLKFKNVNLALNTTMPPKSKKEIYVPDEAEIAGMSEKLSGEAIEIAFLLATQCGLRASEICGLQTDNVFKDHIEIKQALVRGQGGQFLKSPKSFAGFRSIPISEELYRQLMSSAKDNRVCPYTSSKISSMWCEARDRHSFPKACNFHALRHHFASKCLLLGMPQKYTAELMGHNSLDMIEKVYQHTFPSAMEQYADMLRKKNSEFMQHKMQHENKYNK